MVSEIMHAHDDKGFRTRDPTAKKVSRTPKVPIGIHERWAADGHDKLYKIGFPIWAIVDDATGKWLGAWVVPSNRMNVIIGYLFLCCVEKHGGEFSHHRILASLRGIDLIHLQVCHCKLQQIAVQRQHYCMAFVIPSGASTCCICNGVSLITITERPSSQSTIWWSCPHMSTFAVFITFPLSVPGYDYGWISVTTQSISSTMGSKAGCTIRITPNISKWDFSVYAFF
jgi:hypothetical protein